MSGEYLICSFIVPGEITPMGRPRFVRKTGIAFTPPKSRSYQAVLRDYAKQAMSGQAPFDGPCRVHIVAWYPWPSSWSKLKRGRNGNHKGSGADWDNIGKAVTDAMNAIVFTDDARVADARVQKLYADEPGLFVEVSRI